MVTVELSNGHAPTPNGSLPSGTPNRSVPNMTPTSSCSYLTGEGTDPDKVSNKFPDLVEQAQGLEVMETYLGQGQTHDPQGNSDTQSGTKDPNKLVINAESPTSNSSQAQIRLQKLTAKNLCLAQVPHHLLIVYVNLFISKSFELALVMFYLILLITIITHPVFKMAIIVLVDYFFG